MRLDRTISLLLASITRRYTNGKIPILMYHSVSPVVKSMKHPYFCTEITPGTFELHLNYLAENGYTVKPLSELANMTDKTGRAGSRNVIITFDDGYQDFFEYALPLLKKYKMPATMFIPAGLIDKGDCELEGRRLMSWEQIRECCKQGIEIGSHSHTHRVLVDLSSDDLAAELCNSKVLLEEKLNTEITSFAYPYKFPEENKRFVMQLCKMLEMNGYKFGVTTRIGLFKYGNCTLQMKRLPVNEFDDILLYRAKLNGNYNWMYALQYILKMFRSVINSN